jgi:hypothetical protein
VTVDCSPSRLISLYDGLGRQLVAQQRPEFVFQLLTETAVREVPGAEYAGITQGWPGKFVTVAPTHELVTAADQIQYDLGHGPCVDAILEGSLFNSADLRTDQRWPEFGLKAFETCGIVSMLSFRLFLENHDTLAGLNMYSTNEAAFDESAELMGLLLATHGALAVANAAAREQVDNLQHALQTSRDIGIAMGVLMQTHKVTREQAFDLLRIASQHSNRRLAEMPQRSPTPAS